MYFSYKDFYIKKNILLEIKEIIYKNWENSEFCEELAEIYQEIGKNYQNIEMRKKDAKFAY